MNKFNVGEQVAWKMLDGNTMAGTVLDVSHGTLYVRRVDGGTCALKQDDAWKAFPEDVRAAIDFYTNKIGGPRTMVKFLFECIGPTGTRIIPILAESLDAAEKQFDRFYGLEWHWYRIYAETKNQALAVRD